MLNNLEWKEQKYSAYINTTIKPIVHERCAEKRESRKRMSKKDPTKYTWNRKLKILNNNIESERSDK